tara:strand:+ start:31061 stop:31537 length:477 start_codon:yes stop_codon:yes gene_type:complete
MNIIFIIYIFALFIIVSPNVFINLPKINLLLLSVLHGLLFTTIVYLTYDSILRYREGVKIGTLEVDNDEKDLYMSTNLGLDKIVKSSTPQEDTNVVHINNTVLDYSYYKDDLKAMSPLPGPIPKFFDGDIDIPNDVTGEVIFLDGNAPEVSMFSTDNQ